MTHIINKYQYPSRSLCIFDYETHPNMHQKHEKESLSLFGMYAIIIWIY